MLWDARFDAELLGHPQQRGAGGWIALKHTLPEQLAELGLSTREVSILGLSHTISTTSARQRTFPPRDLRLARRIETEWPIAGQAVAVVRMRDGERAGEVLRWGRIPLFARRIRARVLRASAYKDSAYTRSCRSLVFGGPEI